MANTRAAGEPLESVLARLGSAYGVTLRADGALKQQRVTLFLSDAELETVASLLADLLTPAPEATVFWTRQGNGWTLTESVNRRLLVERLQNQDLDPYRQHLENEVAWLHTEEERQAKGEASKEVLQGNPDTLRRVRNERVALAHFLDWLGPKGREKLLTGEAVAVSVGEMPAELRKSFYSYLRDTLASIAGLPDEGVNGYTVAYLLARSPTGSSFIRLVQSIITPEGIWRSRGSVMGMSQGSGPAFFYPPFTLPAVNPADSSRKISLTLGVDPAAKPGTRVFRNLDELLGEVSKGANIQVIADGYLKSRRAIPANLQVKDYPLRQLLDRLTRSWGCEWRFDGEGEKTVLVRSRNWWMEDAADVPEGLLQELHPRLNRKRLPELGDVLRLAELSKAQLHKLIEAGFCPDASGLVQPGWYDETGPKPVLRFFNRLPAALQAKVQSPQGMSLREAPPELVRAWLGNTLVACGATNPQAWTSVTIQLEMRADAPSLPGALIVRLAGPAGEYSTWRISPTADEAAQLRVHG
jgi:hypothetical protein